MTSISDFSSVYFNTLKACMGTGILGFPLIFQIHGIFYTVIFTFISLLASLFGCFLYIDLNERHGKNLTMASLSKHIFPSMKRSVDIIVMIKCFLLTLVYFGRIKSIFSTLFADFELESILKIKPDVGAGIGIVATAFLLSYPITWETLNSLTKFSLLCFVGVVILFFGSFSVTKGKTSEVVFISDNRDFISSVGYFVFGFSCHQNILSIHNETKMKASLFKLCITLSLISVAFIYLAFGYINYKAFSDIPNDIFIIWPACKAKSFTVLTYLCIIVFSIPFQVFPCKNHFGDLVGTSQKR